MWTTFVFRLAILHPLLSLTFAATPIRQPDFFELTNAPNDRSHAAAPSAPPNTSEPTTVGFIPPAPYNYPVRQSRMILRFTGYRGSLPQFDTSLCLLTAANTVITHFGSFSSIGAPLQTNWGRVRLKVYPSRGDGLTWEKWGTAIRGITEFVTMYEFKDMDFYVLMDGKTLGGGLISDH